MKKLAIRLSLVLGTTLSFVWQAHAESNRVTFPENLDRLVHYLTVKRGNVTEHIATTPEAIEAVKKGAPIPDGTHFVLTDYRDGDLYRYFVMEKGKDWGEDYDSRRRTGDWQYQWFWPDKQVNLKENTCRCMACHRSQSDQRYLYTFRSISEYQGTPIE